MQMQLEELTYNTNSHYYDLSWYMVKHFVITALANQATADISTLQGFSKWSQAGQQ